MKQRFAHASPAFAPTLLPQDPCHACPLTFRMGERRALPSREFAWGLVVQSRERGRGCRGKGKQKEQRQGTHIING